MGLLIQSGTEYPKEKLIEPLTELILAGFKGKFIYRFFSIKETETIAKALSVFLASEKSANLMIAEKNKKICGCVYVINKGESNKLLNYYLAQHFSKRKIRKVWLLLGFLSHQPKENELHIDFIAVSPVFRGLGIGRKLINYCKIHCEKEFLTLHVAKNNANAVRLYQSEGFVVKKDLNSLLGSFMTGIKDWWFMRWEKYKIHRISQLEIYK